LILILTAACFHHFGAHIIAFFLVQLPGAGQIGPIGAQRFNAAREQQRYRRTSSH
jgi:hypothetical protein